MSASDKIKVKARFPNESYFVEIFINEKDFKVENKYKDEVFGYLKNTYLSIDRKDFDNYLKN